MQRTAVTYSCHIQEIFMCIAPLVAVCNARMPRTGTCCTLMRLSTDRGFPEIFAFQNRSLYIEDIETLPKPTICDVRCVAMF